MVDTVEKTIFLALLDRAKAFPLPTGWTVETRIAEPGKSFTPPTTGTNKLPAPFISVEIHFNRSIETDLSFEMDPIRQGFMRTNVMWPKGSAIVDAYELAGKLRAHLKRGTKLNRDGVQVRIDEDPEIGVLVTGDTHHNVPLTTRWRSYPSVPA